MTARGRHATRTLRALGTSAVVAVTDPDAAPIAERLLRGTLDAVDRACSRFRDDSEVTALTRAEGAAVTVSGLLYDVLSVAVEVARLTGGAVDPTVGCCLRALGYDRDFGLIEKRPPSTVTPRPAPGWWTIELDPSTRTVSVPSGTVLDLGSCAKAFAADAAATVIAGATGSGAIVSLGGDVAVAGRAPAGGWQIGIAESSASALEDVEDVVAIGRGGLATSAPGARRWGGTQHHIVDPRTGVPVPSYWTLASAAAPTCVEANAFSTAAVVWGPDAVANLAASGCPARLARHDGEVVTLNGWPPDVSRGTPAAVAAAAP